MPANQVSITITSDPHSVAAVRHLACAVASLLGVDVDVDYLALLTTELVTNAVRLEAGAVTTSFERLGGSLRVEVHDLGGGWPVLGNPQPLDESGGRGLLIVDTLADAWGASSSSDHGTTVWFEMHGGGPDRAAPLDG